MKGNIRRFCEAGCTQEATKQLDDLPTLTHQTSLGEAIVSMANCLGLTKAEVGATEKYKGAKSLEVESETCVIYRATIEITWNITTPDIPVKGKKKGKGRKKDDSDEVIPSTELPSFVQNYEFEKKICSEDGSVSGRICGECFVGCGVVGVYPKASGQE